MGDMKKESKIKKTYKKRDLDRCLNRGTNNICKDCCSDPQEEYGCKDHYTFRIKKRDLVSNLITTALFVGPPIIGGILGYFCPETHDITNAFNGALTFGLPGGGLGIIYAISRREYDTSKWEGD